MITEELRQLAERAASVEGHRVDRLEELHRRITIARRRRTVAGVAATAGLAVAMVVGGAALTGPDDRSSSPIDQDAPTPAPSASPTPNDSIDLPAGQQTITPEIGAGDIRGWELRG